MVAEGLSMRACSITVMLSKLRRDKLTVKEEQILYSVFESVTEKDSGSKKGPDESSKETTKPKVLVLRRKRTV